MNCVCVLNWLQPQESRRRATVQAWLHVHTGEAFRRWRPVTGQRPNQLARRQTHPAAAWYDARPLTHSPIHTPTVHSFIHSHSQPFTTPPIYNLTLSPIHTDPFTSSLLTDPHPHPPPHLSCRLTFDMSCGVFLLTEPKPVYAQPGQPDVDLPVSPSDAPIPSAAHDESILRYTPAPL